MLSGICSLSPTMVLNNSVYAISAIGLALYLLKLWLARRSALPLPPGPKGYPLIGNAYDIPHHYPWLTYAEWAHNYGDVFSFNVFGKTTIVLSSLEAVTELLEKRSSNYSDRPRMVLSSYFTWSISVLITVPL